MPCQQPGHQALFSRSIEQAQREAKTPRDKLACDNLPLVVSFVRRIRRELTDDDDLQDGALAILKAADGYDPSRAKFSTYAVRCITNATFRNYNSRRKVPTSCEFPEPTTPSEINDWIENEWVQETISQALDCMSERERLVVQKRYFEGKTLMQVGDELGVCKERIRQVAADGIQRARECMAAGSEELRKRANKEGQLASLGGQPLKSCPYRSRLLRDEWESGWRLQQPPGKRRSK